MGKKTQKRAAARRRAGQAKSRGKQRRDGAPSARRNAGFAGPPSSTPTVCEVDAVSVTDAVTASGEGSRVSAADVAVASAGEASAVSAADPVPAAVAVDRVSAAARPAAAATESVAAAQERSPTEPQADSVTAVAKAPSAVARSSAPSESLTADWDSEVEVRFFSYNEQLAPTLS